MFGIFNLLDSESGAQMSSGGLFGNNVFFWVLIVILALFLVYSFISGRKRRKQMEEQKEKRNDIHPGYKVTTIGGIIGTVVEVDNDANTFVLATGTEENTHYIKFDKQAIYNSENPEATAPEAKPAEEVFGEDDGNKAEAQENAEATEETEETVAGEAEDSSVQEPENKPEE